MHRFLERLDSAASTLVPLLYLCGLALGAIAYFAGVRLAVDGMLVGAALATAAELHSFLAQRRVRAIWGQLSRTPEDAPNRDSLVTQLRAQVAILVGLVAFSAFNSVAFVAATWTPTPGFLPAWLQIGLRGAIIPVLFLLTGALSPLTSDAGAVLQSASHDMLHKAIRVMVKQWSVRIDRARKQGFDLAPVAVALMEDAGDTDGARRIRLIAHGLAQAEGDAPALTTAGLGPTALQTPPALPGLLNAPGDDSPSGGSSGGVSPAVSSDLKQEPSAQAVSGMLTLFSGRAKRVRSRPKPAALRRRDQAARDALDERRRQRAFTMLDANPETSAAAIGKALRCRHRTAANYRAAWERLEHAPVAQ